MRRQMEKSSSYEASEDPPYPPFNRPQLPINPYQPFPVASSSTQTGEDQRTLPRWAAGVYSATHTTLTSESDELIISSEMDTVMGLEEEEEQVFRGRKGRLSSSGRHSLKRHICCVCHKHFSRPSALSSHMSVHTGTKPFACTSPDCGKRFSVLSNMKRHMRKHGSAVVISPESDPGPIPTTSPFPAVSTEAAYQSTHHPAPYITPAVSFYPNSTEPNQRLEHLSRSSMRFRTPSTLGIPPLPHAEYSSRPSSSSLDHTIMKPPPLPFVTPLYEVSTYTSELDDYFDLPIPRHPISLPRLSPSIPPPLDLHSRTSRFSREDLSQAPDSPTLALIPLTTREPLLRSRVSPSFTEEFFPVIHPQRSEITRISESRSQAVRIPRNRPILPLLDLAIPNTVGSQRRRWVVSRLVGSTGIEGRKIDKGRIGRSGPEDEIGSSSSRRYWAGRAAIEGGSGEVHK